MPVPHLNIKIVQRSKGKSAVAGAAYQAGERLFSEYDQQWKNYLCKKEVVYTEIMLPTNAPPEYADRTTLWNSAEEVEKQWNSQLARRFVVALPREVPIEMCPQMMQEYCNEHFVSKGMCCDFAIHDPDPPGHNPHCHIMLTMRAIDENGKWMPKSRKVYDLDENGERIKLPSGRWKSHKEDTVDWNEQYHAEEWRHGWLNYYGIADMKKNIESLNGWLYRRIRMCIWKQWKLPRTRRRKLIGLGVDSHYAATIAYDRKGYWFNAGNKAVNWALSKERLINWGFYDLAVAYQSLHVNY